MNLRSHRKVSVRRHEERGKWRGERREGDDGWNIMKDKDEKKRRDSIGGFKRNAKKEREGELEGA